MASRRVKHAATLYLPQVEELLSRNPGWHTFPEIKGDQTWNVARHVLSWLQRDRKVEVMFDTAIGHHVYRWRRDVRSAGNE